MGTTSYFKYANPVIILCLYVSVSITLESSLAPPTTTLSFCHVKMPKLRPLQNEHDAKKTTKFNIFQKQICKYFVLKTHCEKTEVSVKR